MARQATRLVLAAALAGCTDRVVIDDVWDASPPTPDAEADRPAAPDAEADRAPTSYSDVDRPRWNDDAGCRTSTRKVSFRPQAADLMILLDRSSTMQGSFAGSSSKSTAVRTALTDTINTYQAHIKFGLVEFPDRSCGHYGCCVARQPAVVPQYGALSWISEALQCNDSQGPGSGCLSQSPDSPSHAALAAIPKYQSSWDDGYVLLIAGSEPSCSMDGTTSEDACSGAINAATALGNTGVPVVVLGLNGQAESCLVAVSKAGNKTAMPGTALRLYTPTSATTLKDNLSSLFAAIARASCTASSESWVPDDAALTVTLNDHKIPQADCSASYGWCFAPGAPFHNEIMLLGSSCDEYLKLPEAIDIPAGYACSSCSDSGFSCMPPW